MFSRLTALVGGGPTLPFELGDPAGSAGWAHWQLYQGTLRADGSSVSVFRISASQPSDPKLAAARNGVKRLRTLRHPNVLVFKDTAEVEDKGETVIYLATEPVRPLAQVLQTIGVSGPERNQWISMGLHAVVHALSFLNNDCHLVHGNICLGAVMVTETLDWKLHGFDLTTDHQWQSAYEVPLMAASWMVGPQYKPGELARSEWQVVKESPAWAVDAWGLGCLMQELYSGEALQRTEDLRRTACLPQEVLPHYQRLLASQPARRLNPARLLEEGVLHNRLVETMGFLENLALKDAAEKDAFFKRLPSLLKSIPEPVAQRKLLPMLAGALEFGGAPPVALTTLLQIGETLPDTEHARLVVPIITKLFASADRGIRRGLLENIFTFGPSLPDKLVEEQIYNHVAGGFTDGNPYLRELTLKSMAVLGPKLSQKTLNQSLLKHLAKLQVDEEASIRANTTVLLGNLAPNLGEATCKKVLLNAFSRALKDQFPPARVAGLKAIVATAQYYSPEDAGQRVVPVVGPLCVDPVHEVRASALVCLAHCLKQLQEHHAALERRAAEVGATAAEGALPAGTVGGTSLLGSFGWAVSSLGLSRGGAGEAGPPAASGAPATAPSAAAHAGAAPKAIPSSMPPGSYASTRPKLPALSSPAAASSTDNGWQEADEGKRGWDGEDDALEAMADEEAAERHARQRLSTATLSSSSKNLAAVRAQPLSGSSSARRNASASSTSDSWLGTDNDAEGWSSMDAPAAGSRVPQPPRARPSAATRGSAGAGAAGGVRRGAAGQGGMKLGASKVSKLGAAKLQLADDEDFSSW